MTTKLNPDGPDLELDGEPASKAGDTIADSSWEGLEEEDKTRANLGKLARARKEKRAAARTEG